MTETSSIYAYGVEVPFSELVAGPAKYVLALAARKVMNNAIAETRERYREFELTDDRVEHYVLLTDWGSLQDDLGEDFSDDDLLEAVEEWRLEEDVLMASVSAYDGVVIYPHATTKDGARGNVVIFANTTLTSLDLPGARLTDAQNPTNDEVENLRKVIKLFGLHDAEPQWEVSVLASTY